MKILLIDPSRYGQDGKLIKNRSLFYPSLTLPLLASLTPSGVKVEIINEHFQDIDFSADYDLVGITAYTSKVLRAYEIADEFRKRGRYVVMGGVHVSVEPLEALEHTDTVFISEAEETWPEFLADFQHHAAQKIYEATAKPALDNLPIPNFSLLNLSKYTLVRPRGLLRLLPAPILPVESARGCPHGCHYCVVTQFFGSTYRMRPIPEIISQIKTLKLKGCVFIDDNIFSSPERAKELFKALIPLGILWLGQGTIKAGLDREMLKLARHSGCLTLLLGIESVSLDSLSAVKKNVNTSMDLAQALAGFRQEGISVMASMIFGLPGEGEAIFDRTLEFLVKSKVAYTLWHPLVPFPGTPLYSRMREEHLLLYDKWWLNRQVTADYLSVTHQGLLGRRRPFKEDFLSHYKEFYSLGNIARRVIFPPQKRFMIKTAANMLLGSKIAKTGSIIEN